MFFKKLSFNLTFTFFIYQFIFNFSKIFCNLIHFVLISLESKSFNRKFGGTILKVTLSIAKDQLIYLEGNIF